MNDNMIKTATLNEAKLADYLVEHIEGFVGPLTATKFSGGQSNPTYLLETATNKYVLRRKPVGKLLKSAHAIDREYRVMTALRDSQVPVAHALHYCEDEGVIGSEFYIMAYIDGRVFWDPTLPEISTNAERTAIYTEMNRVLAALHSLDLDAVGLRDYGRPSGFYERHIALWTKQYHASQTIDYPGMNALIEWLPANMPDDDGRFSLVHGDFRLDNMMFSPTQTSVAALVDWELSTLGHPFADLAYQCMQWQLPFSAETRGLAGIDRASLGIPTEEEYVASYCERMGLAEIPNWNFYVAFSAFRFAAILQGIKKRAIDGNAASEKAHSMGDLVAPVAKIGTNLI